MLRADVSGKTPREESKLGEKDAVSSALSMENISVDFEGVTLGFCRNCIFVFPFKMIALKHVKFSYLIEAQRLLLSVYSQKDFIRYRADFTVEY